MSQHRLFSEVRAISRKKPSNTNTTVEHDKPNFQVSYSFETRIRELFEHLHESLEDFNQENGYEFHVTDKALILSTNKDNYVFQPSAVSETLNVVTPFSGMQCYRYDEDEKLWLGKNDRHDFRGLIIRDLLRHSHGLPNL